MLAALTSRERRALFAHERAHLAGRHHRHLLAVRLAARADPFLRLLRTAVVYTAERWADEEAAAAVGSRRSVARASGTAVGFAAWGAAVGATVSALSSANSAVTLLLVLRAATPMQRPVQNRP